MIKYILIALVLLLYDCGSRDKKAADNQTPEQKKDQKIEQKTQGELPEQKSENNTDNHQNTDLSDSSKKGHLNVTPTLAGIQSGIINPKCLACHNQQTHNGGLDLTDISKLIVDEDHGDTHAVNEHSNKPDEDLTFNGSFIVPGKPDQSLFYLITQSEDPRSQMPPPDSDFARLSKDELDAVNRFITQLKML